MKTTVKYILAAALAAVAVLPVSGASAMSAERVLTGSEELETFPQDSLEQDAPDVYTIEQCYDLVRQNYPLHHRAVLRPRPAELPFSQAL